MPDTPDGLAEIRADLEILRPPTALEDRVVRSVIRGRPRMKIWQAVAAVVAGLALIGTGWILHGSLSRPVSPTASERYVLLLLPSSTETGLVGEALESRVRQYADWARRERERGRVLEGHKLADATATVNSELGMSSHIEGYFVVAASSLEEAVDIAMTCPHVTYGGRIEVRQIQQ